MHGDFNDPTPSSPAATDPHQAAVRFRDELLAKDWPDGKRVAEMAGDSPRKNSAQHAARLRASGALLGIWDARHRTFRHPDFQFDAHGKLLPEVAQLLKALPDGKNDRSGWRRAFWMYSPHPGLDAENPAHVFKLDAQRVIDLAKREFDGDGNAHW